jgi:hypothetical protein
MSLVLLNQEMDRQHAAQNLTSLIVTVVIINGNVIQNETATEVALATTVVTTAVQLDVAEAGIATANLTVNEAEKKAAVIATEGRDLEEENPTQWIKPRGHALGSVLVDVHDLPHSAAVANAHAHALVPSLGNRDPEAPHHVPQGSMRTPTLMMTCMRILRSKTTLFQLIHPPQQKNL